MTYNENIKRAIDKWRETHKEEYRKYIRNQCSKYRENNREKCNATRLRCYYEKKPYLKISRIFSEIQL